MKFSTKLIYGFGIILMLFSFVAIIKIKLTEKVNAHISSVTHAGDILKKSSDLQKLVFSLETGYRGYILTEKKEALEPYNRALPKLRMAFIQQRALLADRQRELEKLNIIENKLNLWIDSIASPIIEKKSAIAGSEKTKKEFEYLFRKNITSLAGKRTMDNIKQEFAEFDSIQNEIREENKQVLNNSLINTDRYTIWITLLSIFFGGLVAFLIIRSFTNRVNSMVVQAEGISKGNFNVIIPAKESDELTRLTATLNSMNQRLEESFRELERSNKELEQFAYVASHDLREPLRTISSFVKLLGMKLKEKIDTETSEYLKFISEGTARMEQLISDLLEYSRVGTHGKEFTEVQMQDAAKIAIDNLSLAISEANAKVTVNHLPKVKGDLVQLVQLLQNLVANAIKFRAKNSAPEVDITCEENPGSYLFAVKDNGIGIPPGHTDRIFMIFQRLHSKEEYQGTGIGLAVCKKIVERHGGQIWCESEPEKGTSFYFTLKK